MLFLLALPRHYSPHTGEVVPSARTPPTPWVNISSPLALPLFSFPPLPRTLILLGIYGLLTKECSTLVLISIANVWLTPPLHSP